MTWLPSTEIPGADQLTFFAEDSPAKTSVRQVKEQELAESVRDYGRNMRDSLEKCGLDLSLPKTHHCFALGDLELSSKTWPRWGIMRDGECSELGMSVRLINETECGCWPTPSANKTTASGDLVNADGTPWDGESKPHSAKTGKPVQTALMDKIKHTWPTPTSSEHKYRLTGDSQQSKCLGAIARREAIGGTQTPQIYPTPTVGGMDGGSNSRKAAIKRDNEKELATKKTGQLNPSWVEWLMGWPIGWTDLKPLETDKFRSVQLWHSIFSQKD